jgi:hypothetical protein
MRIGLDHFAENVSGAAPRGYASLVKGADLGAGRCERQLSASLSFGAEYGPAHFGVVGRFGACFV